MELIDEIYKCAYDKDFPFEDFQFKKMFKKKVVNKKSIADGIVFQENMDEDTTLIKNMILNNLWSGLVVLDSSAAHSYDEEELDDSVTTRTYVLPLWSGSGTNKRARNIHPGFFKEGDVLIYSIDYSKTGSGLKHTTENGLYAYIYINGSFVGVNGTTGNGTNGTGDKRNDFKYDYYGTNSSDIAENLYSAYNSLIGGSYNVSEVLTQINYLTLYDKDYYIILRPEKVLQEVVKISVTTAPSNLVYNSKTKKITAQGGILTCTYNDGTSGEKNLESSDIKITGYDATKTGTQTLIVNYGGQTTQMMISVGAVSNEEPTEIPDTHASKNIMYTIIAIIMIGLGSSIMGKQFLTDKQ